MTGLAAPTLETHHAFAPECVPGAAAETGIEGDARTTAIDSLAYISRYSQRVS